MAPADRLNSKQHPSLKMGLKASCSMFVLLIGSGCAMLTPRMAFIAVVSEHDASRSLHAATEAGVALNQLVERQRPGEAFISGRSQALRFLVQQVPIPRRLL